MKRLYFYIFLGLVAELKAMERYSSNLDAFVARGRAYEKKVHTGHAQRQDFMRAICFLRKDRVEMLLAAGFEIKKFNLAAIFIEFPRLLNDYARREGGDYRAVYREMDGFQHRLEYHREVSSAPKYLSSDYEKQFFALLEMVIERGAFFENDSCENTIALLARYNALGVLKFLIKKGVRVPPSLGYGIVKEAFEAAAEEGNSAMVQLLLEQGLDCGGENGTQALIKSLHRNSKYQAAFYMDRRLGVNSEERAVQTFELLLSKNAGTLDERRGIILQTALISGLVPAIKKLLLIAYSDDEEALLAKVVQVASQLDDTSNPNYKHLLMHPDTVEYLVEWGRQLIMKEKAVEKDMVLLLSEVANNIRSWHARDIDGRKLDVQSIFLNAALQSKNKVMVNVMVSSLTLLYGPGQNFPTEEIERLLKAPEKDLSKRYTKILSDPKNIIIALLIAVVLYQLQAIYF
jgi:hypothetical protein